MLGAKPNIPRRRLIFKTRLDNNESLYPVTMSTTTIWMRG
jgi:hypothetical protein